MNYAPIVTPHLLVSLAEQHHESPTPTLTIWCNDLAIHDTYVEISKVTKQQVPHVLIVRSFATNPFHI